MRKTSYIIYVCFHFSLKYIVKALLPVSLFLYVKIAETAGVFIPLSLSIEDS